MEAIGSLGDWSEKGSKMFKVPGCGAGSGRSPKLSGYALAGAVRTCRFVGVANLGGSHVLYSAPAEMLTFLP